MDERRTARLVGLALGMIFACVLVLNALAGY
jgi:tetrahydromethanopterin S-methyltransferase subunit F